MEVCRNGECSDKSNIFKLKFQLPAVSDLKIEFTPDLKVKLSWTNPTDDIWEELIHREDEEFSLDVRLPYTASAPAQREYIDEYVVPGKTYTYSVQVSSQSFGDSVKSGVVRITIPENGFPGN